MRYLRHVFVLAILSLWTGAALGQAVSPDSLRNGPKVVQVFREVVAKPSEYTVRINADGKDVAFGTIVDADGYILTKWSEIRDKAKITCKLKDGKVLEARLVIQKDDPELAYDLAMLKIDAKGLPTVQWREGKSATVGKWLASPGIGADPVAVGIVSVATRKYKQGDQPPKLFNPNAGYLGVVLESTDGGAKVTSVGPKSPAQKAGIKPNDVIYEAGGKRIIDHETLINTVGRLKPGDNVLLKAKRGGEDIEIKVTLGARPKELQGNPQETMGTKLSNRRGGFPNILQHDSGVRPEDCGGPVVDLDGKAIGINIARAGRTETYALPSEDILALLPDLKAGIVLRKQTSLTAKDKLDKDRPKLGPKRFMKMEEVQLMGGNTYVIEMNADKLDAYLILEDTKGKVLAEDDDSGGKDNARIVFHAPNDGPYRIIATTFNPEETGDYTLIVRRQIDAPKENVKK